MTYRHVLTQIVALGVLFGAMVGEVSAGPAPDLTGTWEGKYQCKGLAAGERNKFQVNPSIMKISHISDTEVRLELDGAFLYNGFAAGENAVPAKGAGTFVYCEANATVAYVNEVISADFNTKPAKASFKGQSSFCGVDCTPSGFVGGRCQYVYKRTNTDDPGVNACQ